MVRAEIPGINKVTKRLPNGGTRTYFYFRAMGARLSGKPGSPEFTRDLAAAEKSLRDRLAGSFNGLIRDFTLSLEFDGLRDSTKRQYRRMLTAAEKKFGDMPVAVLEDPRVRKDFMDWRAIVADKSGPREADNRLTAISAMLTWAREAQIITANHLAGFKRIYKSNRAEIIWLPSHIEAFNKVATMEMRRAMILAINTAQRQGDLLKLVWSNYDGTHLTLRQSKTGRKVEIMATAELKEMLDGMDRTAAVILTTPNGHAYTGKNFRQQWRATCRRAKLPDNLHFHDLRGTVVTRFA